MLALRTGIKALQPFSDGEIHALVETGLEVQPVKLRQTAPVAAIQRVVIHQTEGHGGGLLL